MTKKIFNDEKHKKLTNWTRLRCLEKVAKNNRKKNNFKRGNKIELAKVSTLTNHKHST